jgi:hypothetical protein
MRIKVVVISIVFVAVSCLLMFVHEEMQPGEHADGLVDRVKRPEESACAAVAACPSIQLQLI